MDFQDKTIVCADCGREFAHTSEDQKRYAERGFTQDPKRCRECRQVRKEKAATGKGGPRPPRPGGGGFGGGGPRREGRGGFREGGFRENRGRPQHRGGGGGGGFGRGPRQSFEAVCAACGITTTVPFQPTQGREVFCRDCYKKVKGE